MDIQIEHFHIALHCIALHCTALHCPALHCTALHCTALQPLPTPAPHQCSAVQCSAVVPPDLALALPPSSPLAPLARLLRSCADTPAIQERGFQPGQAEGCGWAENGATHQFHIHQSIDQSDVATETQD
jgi:hypothetical protein